MQKVSNIFKMSSSLKVWSKFSVKKKDGTVLKLRVVDMPKYLHTEVINLYINYFVKEENTFIACENLEVTEEHLCKVESNMTYIGIPANPKSLEEFLGPILHISSKDDFNIVICCPDNDDDDEEIKVVAGASMMALVSKNDPEPKLPFKTDELKKLFDMIHFLDDEYNEMKEFDLERCFSDRGLFVCPEFRGLGIAQELLRVRRLICKEHGIPITGAWMTSYGTQIAAKRDGWETVYELQYDVFGEKFGVTFTKEPPSSKFMIARIEH